MRIGIFGQGRLGAAIREAASRAQVEVAWQTGREGMPGSGAEAAIDASAAAAVPAHLDWALASGTPLVIGVTGWEIPDLKARVGAKSGVVVAPNFSIAVALLLRLTRVLGRFAAQDEQRDPYILEHHHARKKDAPSGTARLLASALLEACPRKKGWRIAAPGSPVAPDELDIGVLRAGHTYSTHTIGIDAPGEIIELHHASRTALPYGEGALSAARWIQGRRGVYTMDDVASSILEPLFDGTQT